MKQDQPCPLSGTRVLVENYLRHATNEFHARLYRCDCWTGSSETERPSLSIYFFDRLSLCTDDSGASAKPLSNQARHQLCQLDVKLDIVGLDGEVVYAAQTHGGDESSFAQVDLCNFPRRGQEASWTDPAAPSLELIAVTDKLSAKKKKTKQQTL